MQCLLLSDFTHNVIVCSSGKVAYFTAIFPYLVMLTLLVRGLTLPGAATGLAFFFTPQWEKLASLQVGPTPDKEFSVTVVVLQVWYAAVTQSFFSLSVGFGTLTTYSSYNKFRHNTSKDALIISFADTATSLLAGTVIFSILGHLAHELDLPVDQVPDPVCESEYSSTQLAVPLLSFFSSLGHLCKDFLMELSKNS